MDRLKYEMIRSLRKALGMKDTPKTIASDIMFDFACRMSEGKCTINGKRLQELREMNGISRADFSGYVDTNKATIQGWEEGWAWHNPSSDEILRMAEVFHMTEEEFRKEINAEEEYDSDYDED